MHDGGGRLFVTDHGDDGVTPRIDSPSAVIQARWKLDITAASS